MANPQPLEESAKYQAWLTHLAENQNTIHAIEELHVRRTPKNGQVLYALLQVDADTPEKTKLSPICFLTGDAVSVLVVLIAEETNERYVVLVRQRRICDGSQTFEHPAGMIDQQDTSPLEVAVRELKEETQFDVKPTDVKPLYSKPLYSATSTRDEALHFFYLERRLASADIQALHGKSTGEAQENEHTQLYIATLPEAHKLVSNIHGVMSHLLYLKLVGDYQTMAML